MLCGIRILSIQSRKHVLNPAEYRACTQQQEPDHSDREPSVYLKELDHKGKIGSLRHVQ